MAVFVNRRDELAALDLWWEGPGRGVALVWGRRRVGKTSLVERFAQGRRLAFHTAGGRPVADELAILSGAATPACGNGLRDLGARPFTSWDDALETLAAAATDPLLLVLDEFPERVATNPEKGTRGRNVPFAVPSDQHGLPVLSGRRAFFESASLNPTDKIGRLSQIQWEDAERVAAFDGFCSTNAVTWRCAWTQP